MLALLPLLWAQILIALASGAPSEGDVFALSCGNRGEKDNLEPLPAEAKVLSSPTSASLEVDGGP